MEQDTDRHTEVVGPRVEVPDQPEEEVTHDGEPDPLPEDPDHRRQVVLTRWVHVALGLVVAALGAWLLYRSRTELAFHGASNEPGPGYLPVLLTLCLVALGLVLSAVWLLGPRARSGEAPTLSLEPRQMGRAMLVWLALVVCALLIEPLGFLLAGEVLVLLVIVGIERIRSFPMIVTLLLVPPAMYLLFDILLEVQLPGGNLWY